MKLGTEVVVRYAKALWATIEEANWSDVDQQIISLQTSLKSNIQLQKWLSNPTISSAKKAAFFKSLGDDSALDSKLIQWLVILGENGRLDMLSEALDTARDLLRDLQGVAVAQVSISVPLTDARRTALKNTLEQHFEQKIIMNETVDTGLLGGFIVQLGSQRLDLSLKCQLERMEKAIVG